ncbi:multiple epidermal growth factor-like domains protein 10 [Saccostrea cucullata]|uniref:multiple epidermal growth factor-like domains protein 10 n=1 Tax=Saccostrea cuccullata TaxID=36930 RepID=UPI002ED0EEB1
MNCHFILMLIFVLEINNELMTENPGICSINALSEIIACCHNYYKNGNFCLACPLGTFGSNCNETCPEGFYGHLCKTKCGCRQCDKVNGCLVRTGENSITKEEIYLSSLGALSFMVCLLIGYIIRKKCFRMRSPGIYLQPFVGSERPVALQNDYEFLNRHKDEQSCTAQEKQITDFELNNTNTPNPYIEVL